MRNKILQQMNAVEERLQSASIIMESGIIVDAIPVLFKAADVMTRILLSFKNIALGDFKQDINSLEEQYSKEEWFDKEIIEIFHSLYEKNENYKSRIELGIEERVIKKIFYKTENFFDRTRRYLESQLPSSREKIIRRRIKKIILICVSVLASAVIGFFLIKLFMIIFGPEHGLLAHYYNNIHLEGLPVVERIDKKILFDWGRSGPHPGISGGFSVRWQGAIKIKKTESYIFIVHSDEGIRLYVDNVLLIDTWMEKNREMINKGSIKLEKGFYRIRLEYYFNQQHADIILLWRSKSQKRRIVEHNVLYPPLRKLTSD